MPSPSLDKGDRTFVDQIRFQQAPIVPDGSFGSDDFDEGDPLVSDKQLHERTYSRVLFDDTTTISATTTTFAIVESAGLLSKISAVIPGTIATGADRTVTINVLKSTGGGAFATVLSSNISMDTTTVVRDTVQGTISGSADDLVAGDLLQITVAVAGAAGNQAKGLMVCATVTDSEPTA